jgi:hypothetical protein
VPSTQCNSCGNSVRFEFCKESIRKLAINKISKTLLERSLSLFSNYSRWFTQNRLQLLLLYRRKSPNARWQKFGALVNGGYNKYMAQLVWSTFTISSETTAALVGGFAPLMGLVIAAYRDRHRRDRTEKPPQEELLLRPAGYSLTLRLDELNERLNEKIFWSCVWSAFAGLSAALLGKFAATKLPMLWIGIPVVMLSGTIIPAIVLAIQAFQSRADAINTRLGLRGEQAVAEALNEVGDAGYKAFHDLPAGADWNIDHVAVGTKGVFMVETKARRRRGSWKNQKEHEVRFDGKLLIFPFGVNSKAVPQAERNARWLAEFLTKKTGEPVEVEALIVIPGWFVAPVGTSAVKAMNCSFMTKYLRGRSERVPPAQVRRIVAVLDEKCRTLEF